jgi:hypothetical protein
VLANQIDAAGSGSHDGWHSTKSRFGIHFPHAGAAS